MKRQNFDASTYTKHVRQLANAKLYQTDIASGVPQYERKSIVSNAPLANAATNVLLQEFFPGSSLLVVELPITGALSFDGSSYIRASDTNLQVGAGDFTVEFYFKTTITVNTYPRLFTLGGAISLSCETPSGAGSGTTTFYLYPGGTPIGAVPGASITDRWVHLALVRIGSQFTLYLDGVARGNVTASFNDVGGYVDIGSDGSNHFTGQITQFRLIPGTALYTGNFVRPVTQLKALPGTQLLLNVKSTESRLVDSAAGLTLIVNGTVPYTLIVPPIY